LRSLGLDPDPLNILILRDIANLVRLFLLFLLSCSFFPYRLLDGEVSNRLFVLNAQHLAAKKLLTEKVLVHILDHFELREKVVQLLASLVVNLVASLL